MARRTLQVLGERGLVREGGTGVECFWSSGEIDVAERVIGCLWGRAVVVEPLPV